MSYNKNKGTDADFLLECSHSTSWAEVAGLTEMTAKACAARFLRLCKQGKAGLGQIPMDVNDAPYMPHIVSAPKDAQLTREVLSRSKTMDEAASTLGIPVRMLRHRVSAIARVEKRALKLLDGREVM